jgi:hypothetical protein
MKAFITLLIILFCVNAYAQTGPGGVDDANGSGSLVLWLKANDLAQANGSVVTNWQDASGYNNHAVAVSGSAPSLATNTYHGYPSVNFTAANNTYLRIPHSPSLTPSAVTIFVVGKYTTGSVGWAPFLIKADNYSWLNGYGVTLDGSASQAFTYVSNFSTSGAYATAAINTPAIFTSRFDNTNLDFFISEYWLGNTAYSGTINNSNNFLYLGISPDGAGTGVQAPLNGDIAEVIIYNRALNGAEKLMVSNYLSSKYDLPMAINDLYPHDQPSNGNYFYDVSGVGEDFTPADRMINSKSSIAYISNPRDLDRFKYLLYGHDNRPLSFIYGNLPAGACKRLDRVWRAFDIYGVGPVDFTFDLTGLGTYAPAEMRLVIDTDDDGDFTDEALIAGAVELAPNTFVFNGVPHPWSFRFTIVWMKECAVLAADNFDLSVSKNVNNKIELAWSYTPDAAITHFDVQRSTDGKNWNTIQKVLPLTATTNNIINQKIIDENANAAVNFYRIKMVHANESTKTTNIRKISAAANNDLECYPTIATDVITVSSKLANLKNIIVIDANGKNVTANIKALQVQPNVVRYNVSELPRGLYYISTGGVTVKFVKK